MLVFVVPAATASAYWQSSGSGTGSATTGTLAAPTALTVPTTLTTGSKNIPVSWTASSTANGGVAPTGYYILRSDGSTTSAACASSRTAPVSATSCTDTVPGSGSYTYTAVAVFHSWIAAGSPSTTVVVSGPFGPDLGRATPYSIFGSALTSTGVTTVSGDAGAADTVTVAGFPDGTVQGETHMADSVTAGAKTDILAAYADLKSRTCTTAISGDLAGATFTPGVYCDGGAFALTGVLTFDGQNNPNAIFIIKVDAALNTAAASRMVLVNGASAANIYWQANGAFGAGANSYFYGTVLANGASTVGDSTLLIGRVLSTGAVTLANNVIRFTDALPPTISITGGPTAMATHGQVSIAGITSALPGRTVSIWITQGSVVQQLSAVVQSSSWSASTTTDLAPGSYDVFVRVRDAAGNAITARQTLNVG